MAMSFCRKGVHSFLSLTTAIDTATTTNTDKLPNRCPHLSSSLPGGLGLITATGGDVQRSPNVLESSSVKSTPPSSPPPSAPKKDPGGIGFIDDVGGWVDGLMSCTESLGFESSDERRFDENIEKEMNGNEGNDWVQSRRTTTRPKWKKEGGEVKKFPPPLSSMTRNGQRNFFFRAVRRDGRLELTGVKIDRTEILRASRQDGRLRLHLISDNYTQDCDDEEEEEEEEEEVEQQQGVVEEEEQGDQEEKVVVEEEREQDVEGGGGGGGEGGEEEVIEEEEEEEEEERKEKFDGAEKDTKEESIGEWKFPATSEGFIRCHELVSHHHHHRHHPHNLHIWRQHCVTTG